MAMAMVMVPVQSRDLKNIALGALVASPAARRELPGKGRWASQEPCQEGLDIPREPKYIC
jgi:hypothetical protein